MGNLKGSFNLKYIESLRLHPSIGWALAQIGEARGLQEVWRRTKPELISSLRDSALVQSAESSNRIEGVEVDKPRLVPLVLGSAKPKDRPEEEIVGYRNALKWIHSSYKNITLNPATIQKLHKLSQGGLISDAGKWKSKDNEIIEFSQYGDRKVRFKCLSAKETPRAIADLCDSYNIVIEKQTLPDLVAISNLILDFLCIHPFRDGNGRVSRLLTLLCLYQQGYEVGRYISLERIIENTKEDYYRVLAESSVDWHSSNHDLFPWMAYFLGHLRVGYQELKERVDIQSSDSKTGLIRAIISEMTEPFSVADIVKLQPALDREIIKKTLAQLKKGKKIKLIGKGRGAKWKINKR